MVKATSSLKELGWMAGERLQTLLGNIHFVKVEQVEQVEQVDHGDFTGPDLEINLSVNGRPHRLVCEVKSSGQPRYVRSAIFALNDYSVSHSTFEGPPTKVFVAPYLSEDARRLCRQHDVCYLDFEGNAYLQFDGVFIQTTGPGNSRPERRELKAVFAPKSAQVLHRLLDTPRRAWRLADLARAAHVSLGHVSNVKQSLLNREWAVSDEEGFRLSRPNELLDAWAESYERPGGERLPFYTIHHGKELERLIARALSEANDRGDAMLYSFSAAAYLAPYARHPTTFICASRGVLESIHDQLQLRAASEGENVWIFFPDNEGLFLEKQMPMPGVSCTGPVQTYLDLYVSGDRGREAAEHLRRELLKWNDDG